jgi:hypothetical protein
MLKTSPWRMVRLAEDSWCYPHHGLITSSVHGSASVHFVQPG